MRRRLALVAILVSALAATAPAGKASSPIPQLRQHGRWLVDPQGRAVLLHGVNAV